VVLLPWLCRVGYSMVTSVVEKEVIVNLILLMVFL
jgi:hypothetical protein